MKPLVSVVMVDGSFRDNFYALTSLGRQSLSSSQVELLWVEHGARIREEIQGAIDAIPNARGISLGREGLYHSSYCFNAGIAAARGELIVIPDADVVVEEDFLEGLLALHGEHGKLVSYCYRYNEPQGEHREPVELDHLRRVGGLTNPANWGGCLATRRRWLLEINGYEQHPLFASGDHGNDFDVYVRLKNLGLFVCWPETPVIYHPWHPGTLNYSYSHKLQAIVTRDRARRRTSLAYRGLDGSRDEALPAALAAEVEQARARLEAARPRQEAPPMLISEAAEGGL